MCLDIDICDKDHIQVYSRFWIIDVESVTLRKFNDKLFNSYSLRDRLLTYWHLACYVHDSHALCLRTSKNNWEDLFKVFVNKCIIKNNMYMFFSGSVSIFLFLKCLQKFIQYFPMTPGGDANITHISAGHTII